MKFVWYFVSGFANRTNPQSLFLYFMLSESCTCSFCQPHLSDWIGTLPVAVPCPYPCPTAQLLISKQPEMTLPVLSQGSAFDTKGLLGLIKSENTAVF